MKTSMPLKKKRSLLETYYKKKKRIVIFPLMTRGIKLIRAAILMLLNLENKDLHLIINFMRERCGVAMWIMKD